MENKKQLIFGNLETVHGAIIHTDLSYLNVKRANNIVVASENQMKLFALTISDSAHKYFDDIEMDLSITNIYGANYPSPLIKISLEDNGLENTRDEITKLEEKVNLWMNELKESKIISEFDVQSYLSHDNVTINLNHDDIIKM